MEQLNKKLLEYQSDVKAVAEVKKNMQLRIEEELRLSQKIDNIEKSQLDVHSQDADLQRQQRAIVNDQAIESKRITDIQMDTSSIRKRIEEDRNIIDFTKEQVRKIETRLTEIVNAEVERKQNQTAFIEKQSLLQVEKDNTWKEWQKRFANLEGLGSEFNNQLLELNETHRSIKRSQEEFDEINDRFNRRINEITEMNRLAEERFRQEWVAFKADDQKKVDELYAKPRRGTKRG